MNTVETEQIIPPEIEVISEPSPANILTAALRSLRISAPKVPHSSVLNDHITKADGLPEITLEEVADHDGPSDCWIILYDRVYDITKFLNMHPAGEDVILDYAGRDATLAFRGSGHSKHAFSMLQKYIIGELPADQRIFRRPTGGIRFTDMPE